MDDPLRRLEEELSLVREELGLAHRSVVQLEAGLQSGRRIGIAVGVVMERFQLTADDAFGVLKRLSQERNEKLRDVAERILETGRLPGAQVPHPRADQVNAAVHAEAAPVRNPTGVTDDRRARHDRRGVRGAGECARADR